MIRFKDDKAPWTPRINGGRFRSRIVCVRSSTSDIPTHTHAHTHLHPPFPLWKSSLRETYFRVPSDFSASLKREGGRRCVWKGARGKLLFSFSPFIRFFRSSIVSNWQFHYTLDGLSSLNNNVKGGKRNENRCDFGEFCFRVDKIFCLSWMKVWRFFSSKDGLLELFR